MRRGGPWLLGGLLLLGAGLRLPAARAAELPLRVQIAADNLQGPAPLRVAFTGVAVGGKPPYRHEWQFGDGDRSTEQKPDHDYARAGVYDCRLRVTDAAGQSAEARATITVRGPGGPTPSASPGGGSLAVVPAPPRPTLLARAAAQERLLPRDATNLFNSDYLDQLKKSGRQPALCPVCGQPFYLHSDQNFTCKPRGKHVLEVEHVKVKCPVCGSVFHGSKPHVDYATASIDRDFCYHTVGQGNVHARVWLCPACGYADYSNRFESESPAPESLRRFVDQKLRQKTQRALARMTGVERLLGLPESENPDAAPSREVIDFFLQELNQEDIPDWIKYYNALCIYEVARWSAEKAAQAEPENAEKRKTAETLTQLLASLYLEASHSDRRVVNASIAVPGLSEALVRVNRILPDVTEADPDLLGMLSEACALVDQELTLREREAAAGQPSKGRLENTVIFCLFIKMCGYNDRLGFTAVTEATFRKMLSRMGGDEATGVLADEARGRLYALAREVSYQRNATRIYREILDRGLLAPSDVGPTLYLVAELLRRTGFFAESLDWYSAAHCVPKEQLPPTLARWIEEQVGLPCFDLLKNRKPEINEKDRELLRKVLQRDFNVDFQPLTVFGTPSGEAKGNDLTYVLVDPAQIDRAGNLLGRPGTAGRPGTTGRPGATAVPAASTSCRARLTLLWQAIEGYRGSHAGEYPPNLPALIESGCLTEAEAGEFTCPDCKARYVYQIPGRGPGGSLVLYHRQDPRCSLELHAGGKIVDGAAAEPTGAAEDTPPDSR